jgi:hypothetical protein
VLECSSIRRSTAINQYCAATSLFVGYLPSLLGDSSLVAGVSAERLRSAAGGDDGIDVWRGFFQERRIRQMV